MTFSIIPIYAFNQRWAVTYQDYIIFCNDIACKTSCRVQDDRRSMLCETLTSSTPGPSNQVASQDCSTTRRNIRCSTKPFEGTANRMSCVNDSKKAKVICLMNQSLLCHPVGGSSYERCILIPFCMVLYMPGILENPHFASMENLRGKNFKILFNVYVFMFLRKSALSEKETDETWKPFMNQL